MRWRIDRFYQLCRKQSNVESRLCKFPQGVSCRFIILKWNLFSCESGSPFWPLEEDDNRSCRKGKENNLELYIIVIRKMPRRSFGINQQIEFFFKSFMPSVISVIKSGDHKVIVFEQWIYTCGSTTFEMKPRIQCNWLIVYFFNTPTYPVHYWHLPVDLIAAYVISIRVESGREVLCQNKLFKFKTFAREYICGNTVTTRIRIMKRCWIIWLGTNV